jgi:dolichol-phosphate mannosyltransferase
MIHKVFSLVHDFHLLIIDDGSPDGTAKIVKSLQRDYARSFSLLSERGSWV